MKVLISLLAGCCVSGAVPEGGDWMKELPGSTPLSQISIPGSHDAGALLEPLSGTAKCQSLTIDAQLAAGVRFLDVRCRHVRDAFLIYHGPIDQKLTFDQVMASVTTFLKAHPTECVVMSIKEEYDPEGNTRSFEETFDRQVAKEPSRWSLEPGLPTLDQTRGKIVLFRRFAAKGAPKGIDASKWPDNAAFAAGVLNVQDVYQVSNPEAKWMAVQSLLDKAAKGEPGTLFVNFTSATGNTFGIPNIPSMSQPIHRKLSAYLNQHPKGRYGIVITDFVTEELCRRVYESNGARP